MIEKLILSIKWNENIENLVSRIVRIILALKPMSQQENFMIFVRKCSGYNPYALYEALNQAEKMHSINEVLFSDANSIIKESILGLKKEDVFDIYGVTNYSLAINDKDLFDYIMENISFDHPCFEFMQNIYESSYRINPNVLITYLLFANKYISQAEYIDTLANNEVKIKCNSDIEKENVARLFNLLFDSEYYVACRYLEKKMTDEIFAKCDITSVDVFTDILYRNKAESFDFYSLCMLIRNIYRRQYGDFQACIVWFELMEKIYDDVPDWVYFVYWTDSINSSNHIIPNNINQKGELEYVSLIPKGKLRKILDITIDNLLVYGNKDTAVLLRKLGVFNIYNDYNIFQKRYYGRKKINNKEIINNLSKNGCNVTDIIDIYFRSFWRTECFFADVLDEIPKIKDGFVFKHSNQYLLDGRYGASHGDNKETRHLYFDGVYDVYKGSGQLKYSMKYPEEKGDTFLGIYNNGYRFSFYFHGYSPKNKTVYIDYVSCEDDVEFSYDIFVDYLHASNLKRVINLLYKHKNSYFVQIPQIIYLHEKLMRVVLRAEQSGNEVDDYLVANLIHEFNKITKNKYAYMIDGELPPYNFNGQIREKTEIAFGKIMRYCSKQISVWFYFNTSIRCIMPFDKFENKVNKGGKIDLRKMRLMDRVIFRVRISDDKYKFDNLKLSSKISLNIEGKIIKKDYSITKGKLIYVRFLSLYNSCINCEIVKPNDVVKYQPNTSFNKLIYKISERDILDSEWAVLSNNRVSHDRIRLIPYLKAMRKAYMVDSVDEYINKLNKLSVNNLYRNGKCYDIQFGRPFTEDEKRIIKERFIMQYSENEKTNMNFLYNNSFLKLIISDEELEEIRNMGGGKI